jgi:methylglutaconyl-CoA hydratase
LVHEVEADQAALQERSSELIEQFLKNGPAAMAGAKRLISAVAGRQLDDDLLRDTAARIAEQRASSEGREGLSAFLEKRKPGWIRE